MMKLKSRTDGAIKMPAGKIVHSTSDAYGTILVVDYPRYRVLTFDSVYEQSGFYLEKPYALVHEYIRIMMLVLGFIAPKHATLLGLGGGSLLRSLHHYVSDCHFHVVELRAKVYEVAREYFDIPGDERVRVSIDDAKTVLKTSTDASTDIIFADMYGAYHMSPIQGQKVFVQECWRTLSSSGWLVINFHQLPDTHSPFFKCLLEHFRTIMVCSGQQGNHILFAGKSHYVSYEEAPFRLERMEKALTENFMPLYQKLEYFAF